MLRQLINKMRKPLTLEYVNNYLRSKGVATNERGENGLSFKLYDRRSLNFPWQAPEVLTKDGAYTIQEERDVRNAMQLCSESFDL